MFLDLYLKYFITIRVEWGFWYQAFFIVIEQFLHLLLIISKAVCVIIMSHDLYHLSHCFVCGPN